MDELTKANRSGKWYTGCRSHGFNQIVCLHKGVIEWYSKSIVICDECTFLWVKKCFLFLQCLDCCFWENQKEVPRKTQETGVPDPGPHGEIRGPGNGGEGRPVTALFSLVVVHWKIFVRSMWIFYYKCFWLKRGNFLVYTTNAHRLKSLMVMLSKTAKLPY